MNRTNVQPLKLHLAKDYFLRGVLRSYWLERVTIGDGWFICLHTLDASYLYLATARGELREFKSLDTAVGVLEDIGFKVDILEMRGR
jgi:hypothetical protein